jgi:hypothetical protein
MIYRAAFPIDVSSSDFILTRVCSALYIGSGGNLIVDMGAPNPIIQSAQACISGIDPTTGAITAVTLLYGGKGYASAPKVNISAPYGGSGAVITATLTGSVVTSLAISSAGTGYNVAIDNNPVLPVLSFSGGFGTGITFVVPTAGGIILPISVSKVYHTSTASEIVLLYESFGSTQLGF